ncbi:hypothetical protein NK6_9608 [Bradyrhizobium diazoefficiens]|uniref:Uncharacterized protein n=1 Tax=Bradyrhizobium diazoefficiens TaxID=1355477 RepID=A0A0E4FYF8_9BRAD|nr:hypothetical protein NK6_9608 [Bradyrhizobium diazoefficiens]
MIWIYAFVQFSLSNVGIVSPLVTVEPGEFSII